MTRRHIPIRRRGSASRLNRRVRQILYKAVEARIPIKRACDLANISLSTYHRWMNEGKDPSKPLYYEFRKKMTQIQTKKEIEALKVIEKAQKGGDKILEKKIVLGGKYGRIITTTKKTMAPNWLAAAWWLERARDGYAVRVEKEEEKTPQEAALEIREAMNAIDSSIPSAEDEGEDE